MALFDNIIEFSVFCNTHKVRLPEFFLKYIDDSKYLIIIDGFEMLNIDQEPVDTISEALENSIKLLNDYLNDDINFLNFIGKLSYYSDDRMMID